MSDKILGDPAVKAIQDSVKTATLEVGEEQFTTRQVFLPPPESKAQNLKLHTLTGLINYVETDMDGALENGAVVHVRDYQYVDVVSAVEGRHRIRHVYATAEAENCEFIFGSFTDCETFIIGLLANFAQTDELREVLKIVGNIKEENIRQTDDDGITQTVIAKTGIARVGEVEVPNRVELSPFRTFREVYQPTSEFVLRMKQNREGQMPLCALFEADGGRWQLDAIESICDYLKEKLKKVTIIA